MKHQTLARTLLVCIIFLLPLVAIAQSIPALSTNLSGTITTTNTFQTVQAQNNGRKGCQIQNNGTHTMYVFASTPASPATGTSYQMAAGGTFSCAINGTLVLQDAISITGTSGDAFYANFQ